MNTSVLMFIYGNELCVALGKFCNPPKGKKKLPINVVYFIYILERS